MIADAAEVCRLNGERQSIMVSDSRRFPFLDLRKNGSVCLWVYIQPRAARTGFVGVHDGCLKLAVTAPPIDNKANTAVAAYLADFFHIARNRIRIECGAKSRRKLFCLDGLEMAILQERLGPFFQQECTESDE